MVQLPRSLARADAPVAAAHAPLSDDARRIARSASTARTVGPGCRSAVSASARRRLALRSCRSAAVARRWRSASARARLLAPGDESARWGPLMPDVLMRAQSSSIRRFSDLVEVTATLPEPPARHGARESSSGARIGPVSRPADLQEARTDQHSVPAKRVHDVGLGRLVAVRPRRRGAGVPRALHDLRRWLRRSRRVRCAL